MNQNPVDRLVSLINSRASVQSIPTTYLHDADESKVRDRIQSADPSHLKEARAITTYQHRDACRQARGFLLHLAACADYLFPDAVVTEPDVTYPFEEAYCEVSSVGLQSNGLTLTLSVFGNGHCQISYILPSNEFLDARACFNVLVQMQETTLGFEEHEFHVDVLNAALVIALTYRVLLADRKQHVESLDDLRFNYESGMGAIEDVQDKSRPELIVMYRDLLAHTEYGENDLLPNENLESLDRVELLYLIADLRSLIEEADLDAEQYVAPEDESDDEWEDEPLTIEEMRQILVREGKLTAVDSRSKSDQEIESLFNAAFHINPLR